MKRTKKKTERRTVPTKPTRDSLLTDQDLHLFHEGTHHRLYRKLGAHLGSRNGKPGVFFAVWAPDAKSVSVMGDWNGWSKTGDTLRRGASGIWSGFVPGVGSGTVYKYHVCSKHMGYRADKADPFGFQQEQPSRTGSIVWGLDYEWSDRQWMAERGKRQAVDRPMSVYEIHLPSWRRPPDRPDGFYNYREIAPRLADYVEDAGFTHIELMPVTEHPYYASWGYEATGYFAPTSRMGTPQDLMYLVDHLHQRGIGVILDWVPAHFPRDEHGIGFFDGSHLYEHADPRKGVHPDWNSFIFNYGRREVRSFLLSSAMFWLDRYHLDGLRLDAVASMLYLDYSRDEGEWVPNEFGGRENLEAVEFLRQMNKTVYTEHPDIHTIAEESTSWPMVSKPAYIGGLGFGMKWDMGWMHDTLEYMSADPVFRKFQHNQITFRMMYAFSENFLLPLSHDEVVHGKGSLLGKMSGDEWQKFANLRLLFGYMWTQPGKKLLFMGGELGEWREWNHDGSVDWPLLDVPSHSGVHRWVADLNRLYRDEAALHEQDFEPAGFEWIDCSDAERSVLSYLRRGKSEDDVLLVVCNFTPVVRSNYAVGAPGPGVWREVLNSDAEIYGGAGNDNGGGLEASSVGVHGRRYSLDLTLPPLSVSVFKCESEET